MATSTAASSAASSASSSATGVPNISSLVASASSAATAATSSSVSVISGAPSLTSSISQLTGLPTLSGYYSIASPTVPPRAGAPYLQEIALPQKFVFILVGAVIAFFAAVLLAWRFLAAWSINRNIKRDGLSNAAYTPLNPYTVDAKPGGGPYNNNAGGNHRRHSTLMSMGGGGANNFNGKEGNGRTVEHGHDMVDLSHTLPKSFGNSVPSLFFSPTAEVARQSMIRPQSQHLASGHYRDVSK